MNKNDIRLSKASTEMMQDINQEMRNQKLSTLTSSLLIYGIFNYNDTSGMNLLENYLEDNQVQSFEIEMFISENMNYSSNEEPEKHESSENKANIETSESASVTEKEFNFYFTDAENRHLSFDITEDVYLVIEKLLEIINDFSIKEIEPSHFLVAMFMADNKTLKSLFEQTAISYKDAKKYFKPENIIALSNIPFELSGFLFLLNDRTCTEKPCEILMRDKEVNTLWNIMLKKNKRNAVIVGEAGVGKTALIEKITYDINKGACPEPFKNFKVITLDVNSLIAGTSFRGDAEKRIESLIVFLKNNQNVILFIDEVHTILGAGSCYEGEMDLANALKPILARGETIVIGATTYNEYEKYFKKDAALSRRFEKVEVKEPVSKNVYPMIKNKIDALSEFHGVKIKKSMVEYTIMIANCFAFEKKNPDKTLDLIDRAMVSARRLNKKWVDKSCVLKNFSISFKQWDKMSEESKKEIAYHEAGHYIVGKASKKLVAHNFLAISIMPAEDYYGVTVYEYNEEIIPFYDMQYYIDLIGFDLGGRAAENMFRKTYTSGAYADLQSATQTAFMVVTRLGMGSDSLKNRIYLNSENYPMFSEKAINFINEEVNSVIEKAFERAVNILKENKDILEAIVEALLKNRIMSEYELDKIWKDVVSKRTK